MSDSQSGKMLLRLWTVAFPAGHSITIEATHLQRRNDGTEFYRESVLMGFFPDANIAGYYVDDSE